MYGYGYGQRNNRTDKYTYMSGLPNFAVDKYSLAFNASQAELMGDLDVNTLYFRDANFNRVAATFSRTSSATRVNKQGLIETVATGVPRIDYSDGSAKLLMEPSRTNGFPFSSTPLSWANIPSIDNTRQNPDSTSGVAYYDSLTPGSVFGNPISYNIGETITYSVYVRTRPENIGQSFTLWIRYNNINYSSPGIILTSEYLDWKRVTFTHTMTVTAIPVLRFYAFGNGGMTADYLEFFAPQVEAGSYPTSYIPTAGSAVTRNVDRCYVTGMDGYLNTTAYGVHADYSIPYIGESIGINPYYLTIGFSIAQRNFVYHQPSNNNRFIHSYFDGAVAFSEIDNNYSIGDFKFASRIKSGDSLTAINGTLTNHTEVITIPAFDTTGVGGSQNGTATDLIYVSKLLFFPTALTDSECIQLTS